MKVAVPMVPTCMHILCDFPFKSFPVDSAEHGEKDSQVEDNSLCCIFSAEGLLPCWCYFLQEGVYL